MSPSDASDCPSPDVSVVIPAYNAATTLSACLTALLHQTVPLDPAEIIVVDDGSHDGTAATAACLGVRVICQPHTNQAVARNRGAKAARGTILLFTDADCEPAPDWVERMLAPFADPTVAGVKGRYRTRQRGIVPRFIQQEFEQKYDHLRRSRQLDFIDGYAAGYRRDIFFALGGFDPHYPPVEDIELSFRAARQGYRLVFAPDAVVYHRHRDTLRDYARTKARAATLWVEVYRAHPTKIANDSRQPYLVVLQIVAIGLGGMLLPLLPFSRQARRLAGLLSLGFLATTLPLTLRALRSDPAIAPAVPLLSLVRAASQAFGIARGVGQRLARHPALATLKRGRPAPQQHG
ncbi:MAG: hypothetical protein KatS3mg061_0518 [Dehalococcoidia bacterium]|nr:MAG: hypothetical protein KatS3mg061_0518 [Dehalococcoidia bacterium]